MASEIAACGQVMGLWDASASVPFAEQVQRVTQHWQSPLPRLLVFDNCEDPALVKQWRPKSSGCRVLVTTRCLTWEPSTGVQAVRVDVLPRAESINLLRGVCSRLTAAEAEALAAELADFPLALHLAGSYLSVYPSVSATIYGNEVRDQKLRHPSLTSERQRKRYSPTDHDLNVSATFNLSYGRLEPADAIDALARLLLARAACFAPNEPLPREILVRTIRKQTNPLDADDALRRLSEVGLLEIADDTATIHPLVAYFAHDTADDAAQDDVETLVNSVMYEANIAGYPLKLVTLQAHLRHITTLALNRGDDLGATLANNLATHFKSLGNYEAGRPLYERSLAIMEAVLGPQHPSTAQALNNLAALLDSMGAYAAARPLLERSLAINEAVLGPQHPSTATSLNNLARLLKNMDEREQALPLMRRALTILVATLGEQHPYTQASQQSLARMEQALGGQ